MDCSVIIATHNRSHLLADTLRSLSAQQVPRTLQWEMVVVDNSANKNVPTNGDLVPTNP